MFSYMLIKKKQKNMLTYSKYINFHCKVAVVLKITVFTMSLFNYHYVEKLSKLFKV